MLKTPEARYIFEQGNFEIEDRARSIWHSSQPSNSIEELSHRKDGALLLMQYRTDGLLHGPSRVFFSDGSLASERWFVYGCLHGRAIDFSSKGHIVFRSAYLEGSFHGDYERWRSDGSLLLSGHFSRGKADGVFTVYAPNGLVLRQTVFSDGRRNGVEFAWTEDHFALFCERWIQGERGEIILPDPLLKRPHARTS